MTPPDAFQIPVDVEGLSIRNVEVLKPSAEVLAPRGTIEGAWNALITEPAIGMTWNVSNVLTELLSSRKPLGVDLEGFSLDSFH